MSAELAGLPVLAAQADASLSSSGRRMLMLLAGLVAVGLVLLAVLRTVRAGARPARADRARDGLVVADPVRDPDPAEPDVGHARRARDRDLDRVQRAAVRAVPQPSGAPAATPAEALARTYRFTGSAVLASGITAIAGFGVLALSSITMLRDFGLVTLVDLTVSLGGVLLVLPSVLALSERRGRAAGRRASCAGRVAGGLPRRRRARVA